MESLKNYCFSVLTPGKDTIIVPGTATVGGIQKILVTFVNDNSGIGLPRRTSIASKLNITGNIPFKYRIKILCSADSTKVGTIWGRNSTISEMNIFYYPVIKDTDGSTLTNITFSKGDVLDILLFWDGSEYGALIIDHKQ